MPPFGSRIVGRKTLALAGVGTGAAETIVAAVTDKRIRVLGLIVTANSTSATATIDDAAAAKMGDYLTAAPIVLPVADCGWFETGASKALRLTVTNGTFFGGTLLYEVIP